MSVEKTIIIGSGPAGHTAAIYAGRAMLNPLMFEGFMAGGVAAGGQLTTTTDVENYPGFPDGISGPSLMDAMREQSLHSGTRIETKTVDRVDLSKRPFEIFVGDDVFLTESLIIATGAVAKRLHLPGEDVYRQKGVSACAVCDGALPIFRNQHLIVIGGGDSACEEAHFLTKFASHVTMLVRRDTLRASKIMQKRVMDHEKITVMRNTEAKEIQGDENRMTGIMVFNNNSGKSQKIDAGGLFYAIGHKPNTDFLEGQVDLDSTGYIMTRSRYMREFAYGGVTISEHDISNLRETSHRFQTVTSVQGVFAAGDVTDKTYRQAVTSAGTGCMAALEVEHFLQA